MIQHIYYDPLDTLILTILSQNTNDKNRDLAYANLIEKYRSWDKVAAAPLQKIASLIKVGGLSNQKSKTIKSTLAWIKHINKKLELNFLCPMDTAEATRLLTSQKGIGIKTAYVTLLFGCSKKVFPVDTHILRISKRLGLIPEKTTLEKAHMLLNKIIPKDQCYSLHLNLIAHGKNICQARKPKCDRCKIRKYCRFVTKVCS
ncbi:MAG: endonuclease III [bacterium]